MPQAALTLGTPIGGGLKGPVSEFVLRRHPLHGVTESDATPSADIATLCSSVHASAPVEVDQGHREDSTQGAAGRIAAPKGQTHLLTEQDPRDLFLRTSRATA